jgi:5-methyltetrahydrofolate--homocysteine methyltransferase
VIGLFAVTAGKGIEKWVKKFEEENDDYSSIMLKVLADRLAEALPNTCIRRSEGNTGVMPLMKNLSQRLLRESYQGIRPAPGYPACPEHSEKLKLFDLLRLIKKPASALPKILQCILRHL